MLNIRHFIIGVSLCAAASASAWAQDTGAELRPASSTIIGDTGLWFVPLGETLPKGKWSGQAALVNFDRTETFSDMSDFSGMFAFGATDRVEVFGVLAAQRRVDADRRPLLGDGTPMDYPINSTWSTGFGDISVGAKFKVWSRQGANPAAFAIRAAVKLPTASIDNGLGTGQVGVTLDGIVSGDFNQKLDVSGYVGLNLRPSPDDYTLSNGLRWGFGVGYPNRARFQFFGELTGEAYFDSTVTFSGKPSAVLGGPPASWTVDSPADAFVGLQYRAANGFYAGTGLSLGLSTAARSATPGVTFDEGSGDRLGFQVRIGYHPGTPDYVARAASAAAAAAAKPVAEAPRPAPPANRPPTVKIRCEPCTIETGKSISATADGQDPDGDTLRYKWSSPTGAFGNANNRQTPWTAPAQPGAVPLTVTVDDGKGGTASDTATIQVVAPPRKEYTFEDVHFDFDRYSLRPEATRLLDDAIKAMSEDRALRITLEGHTCNIGTTEYNLALGERRANAVRDYLTGRGIGADRLQLVSYGEERPKHDNSREETRRLNRRAALTIRMQ